MRDENGELILDSQGQSDHWAEYFGKVLSLGVDSEDLSKLDGEEEIVSFDCLIDEDGPLALD